MTSASFTRPVGQKFRQKTLEVEISALTPQVLTEWVAKDEEQGHKDIYSRLHH